MNTITISRPQHFDLHRTINSHGWYDLPPFRANENLTELHAVIALPKDRQAAVLVKANTTSLSAKILSPQTIGSSDKKIITNSVRSMCRIDEQLDDFYALCRKEPHLRWVPKVNAGRLLRSSTVFEDVVKMMCTTNCSWSLTKIMISNLTTKLGTEVLDKVFSFPTPEVIARKSEKWLRKEISCGYRAPYLLEFCRKISAHTVEIESLRASDRPTIELYEKLRSIKGIGHYAAGNLLKLLGRYDYLGIDSWVRKRFSEIHKNGRKISDAAIEKHYEKYGAWRGLVCWMEVTSDWHVNNGK